MGQGVPLSSVRLPGPRPVPAYLAAMDGEELACSVRVLAMIGRPGMDMANFVRFSRRGRELRGLAPLFLWILL